MDNVVIENEHLRINISALGAELVGMVDKHDGVEHLWRADPKFWPRCAPILFPTIGESRGGKITVNQKDYSMTRHGFARHMNFEMVFRSADRASFLLKSNRETLKHYPFHFEFEISYSLSENQIQQAFSVRNTGIEKLGFQLGGHPAFSVPFNTGENYTDYEIGFDRTMKIDRHLLTEDGLFFGETRPFLKNQSSFGLSYKLFNEDALVFKNIDSKKVWIQKKSGGKRIMMEYEEFPHLGIWSIPGADYVCLEPWIGCADYVGQAEDFWKKDNLIELESKSEFQTAFQITVG